MMVLLSSPMSAQDTPNEKAKVIGIDHSDFVSDIYPKMKRPLIMLFGSNYCGYSRSQMKLLNKIVKEKIIINMLIFTVSMLILMRIMSG